MPIYAIELAIYTGMRIGELTGLKWEDIVEDKYILIRRSEKYDRTEKRYYIADTKTYKTTNIPDK